MDCHFCATHVYVILMCGVALLPSVLVMQQPARVSGKSLLNIVEGRGNAFGLNYLWVHSMVDSVMLFLQFSREVLNCVVMMYWTLCQSAGSLCKQEALKLTLKNIAQMKQTIQSCNLCKKVERSLEIHNRNESCDGIVLLWEYPQVVNSETHCRPTMPDALTVHVWRKLETLFCECIPGKLL